MLVVMSDVFNGHCFEMTLVEDQQPIETLAPNRAHKSLGKGIRARRSDQCPDDPRVSERNTSSKSAVNFVSRSRMRNFTGVARSERTTLKLRACWVTHGPIGRAVTPAK